jgi:lipoic acid synthetase
MIELPVISEEATRRKKPNWLRVKLPVGKEYAKVRKLVDEHKLHTICESGNCPNMGECWGAGTATFMILGNVCTRSCSFLERQISKYATVGTMLIVLLQILHLTIRLLIM